MNLTLVFRAAAGTIELDAKLRLGSGFAHACFRSAEASVSNADAVSTPRATT